jgi:hypothetical protein
MYITVLRGAKREFCRLNYPDTANKIGCTSRYVREVCSVGWQRCDDTGLHQQSKADLSGGRIKEVEEQNRECRRDLHGAISYTRNSPFTTITITLFAAMPYLDEITYRPCACITTCRGCV